MRPKGAIVQCDLSPKAAHVGYGDPAQSELRNGHPPGNNLIPCRICWVGIGVEGEYYGKYLGEQSECRGAEYVELVFARARHGSILDASSTT